MFRCPRCVADMRYQAVLQLAAVTVLLRITWEFYMNSSDIQKTARRILGLSSIDPNELKVQTTAPQAKCGLSSVCPSNHFAVLVRSGAANIVGPKICFEGKIVMSHVFNNVGPGLNIVVVNGDKGVVENFGYLDMIDGRLGEIARFLRQIKPGRIVLVASFIDVATKMTTEMRELFIGMGSTLINSVKPRDSWVFVGRAGAGNSSLFEKHAVNDEKNNIYEEWPGMVEVAGCFPRTENDNAGYTTLP